MQGCRTHYLFSPEGHLGVIKTAMVVVAAGTIYKTMSMMQLTSNCALKQFVTFQLCRCFITFVTCSWGDIVFTSPLLCLAGGVFGLDCK